MLSVKLLKILPSFLLATLLLASCGNDSGDQAVMSPEQLAEEQDAFEQLGVLKFSKPRPLKKVLLTSLEGKPMSIGDFSGKWQVVNFGYMTCPDICSMNLALLSDIENQWQKTSSVALQVTHVTFDPARDTPERLKEFLAYMNEDFLGLTGEPENIKALATQLNMTYRFEEPDSAGHYFISHSDSFALINPKGEYVAIVKGPYKRDNILEALAKLTQ